MEASEKDLGNTLVIVCIVAFLFMLISSCMASIFVKNMEKFQIVGIVAAFIQVVGAGAILAIAIRDIRAYRDYTALLWAIYLLVMLCLTVVLSYLINSPINAPSDYQVGTQKLAGINFRDNTLISNLLNIYSDHSELVTFLASKAFGVFAFLLTTAATIIINIDLISYYYFENERRIPDWAYIIPPIFFVFIAFNFGIFG